MTLPCGKTNSATVKLSTCLAPAQPSFGSAIAVLHPDVDSVGVEPWSCAQPAMRARRAHGNKVSEGRRHG